ncbi:MAG: polysaccharide pyruvyl transferase family protein [Beijerinckiaceae bacterium]|nr:polysaccharide pyruvyl transferase family protein [Beijerinckiaceae bacterium]
MRIALLWQTRDFGLYSNSDFDALYKGVGHNNGNLAFVHAIANQLEGEITYFPWHARPEIIATNADIVVIPCANQIGGHTDLGSAAERLTKVGKPIVAIGLGVQNEDQKSDVVVKEGTLNWAKTLAAHAAGSSPNIATRGQYSTDQLTRLGVENTLPFGCPSFLTNQRPALGERIYKNWTSKPLPRSISVAGGHQAWGYTRHIEHALISLMMDPAAPGQYVVQSMSDMVKISRCEFDTIEPDALKKIHDHTVPHYTRDEFFAWCRNYARSFYDVPAWMDTLRNHDLSVGCRYHGVALALQAERMGLTITIDSRTEELCQNTAVPFLRARELTSTITRKSLKDAIRFDPVAYDKKRAESAKRYAAFLEGNGLRPKRFIYEIAESH